MFIPMLTSYTHVCRFSIEQCLTFGENCLTSQWSSNATTLIDSTSLYSPRDLYIDRNRVLYVLDSGNYRVQRLVPNSTPEPTYLNATTGSVFNELSYRKSSFIFLQESN